jgi:hypothetical protein
MLQSKKRGRWLFHQSTGSKTEIQLMLKLLLYALTMIGFYGYSQQQPVVLSTYVLQNFSKGTVKVKSGVTSSQVLNYNMLTGEMVYDNNGKYLAIANPEDVDTVFIEGRKFIPVEKRFYEWLTGKEDPLFVDYTCSIREPGVETGFGTTRTTSAAALRNLINSGMAYQLKLPSDYEVVQSRSYYIKKKYQYFKINSASKLVKLYPEKKKIIDKWIKENNTSFQKGEEVIALINAIH